jgi:hypothetical protein
MKTCTRCNISKELIFFVKNKRQKDGYHYICKECHSIYKQNNKEKIKNNNKQWVLSNKDYVKTYNKKYNTENKEKKHKITQEFFKNNPDYMKLWKNNKYHNDIQFKIKDNLRSRFYNALLKHYKIISILDIIGCSIDDLKKHLETQFLPEMNWENHGEIWEIDHITPCSYFDLTKIEEQKKCFNYNNLQPLFKTTQIAESFGYINNIGNRNKNNKII